MVRVPTPDADDLRFLILAGPMGDGEGSYQVYEWDGENAVPGTDKPDAHNHATLQCEIPLPPDAPDAPDAKAEGIGMVEARPGEYEFVIVYDGADKGAPPGSDARDRRRSEHHNTDYH